MSNCDACGRYLPVTGTAAGPRSALRRCADSWSCWLAVDRARREAERLAAEAAYAALPKCAVCSLPVGRTNKVGACGRSEECRREASRRRRAACTRRPLTGKARTAVMATLAASQLGLCTWCSYPLARGVGRPGWELDHIIPVSLGGPEDGWNRQVLHAGCNSEKGTQITAGARFLAAKYGIPLAGGDSADPAGVTYRLGELTREELVARLGA